MNLYAFGLAYLFYLFTCTLYVGYHNCDFPIVAVVVVVVVVVVPIDVGWTAGVVI